jgi:hypothetical protein
MTSMARDAGYHANAAYTDSDKASLASAAQDFATASAANRAAFEQLTLTNGNLSSQVANMAVQNQQLQQQMSQLQQHMMFMAAAPPQQYMPAGRGGRGASSQSAAEQQSQSSGTTSALWHDPAPLWWWGTSVSSSRTPGTIHATGSGSLHANTTNGALHAKATSGPNAHANPTHTTGIWSIPAATARKWLLTDAAAVPPAEQQTICQHELLLDARRRHCRQPHESHLPPPCIAIPQPAGHTLQYHGR